MSCVMIDVLPVHMKVSPPVEGHTEKEIAQLIDKVGTIVSRMETTGSFNTQYKKLSQKNLCTLEEDRVRDELKWKISAALEAGGIPSGTIYSFAMMFASLLMKRTMTVYAERGKSVILYLRPLSLESLSSLYEMMWSGFLLRLLSDVMKGFIQSQSQVQLVVRAEDFNMCVSCLRRTAGRREASLLQFLLPQTDDASNLYVLSTVNQSQTSSSAICDCCVGQIWLKVEENILHILRVCL